MLIFYTRECLLVFFLHGLRKCGDRVSSIPDCMNSLSSAFNIVLEKNLESSPTDVYFIRVKFCNWFSID